MITQAQYLNLCAGVASENRDRLSFTDVADLLESFEVLHALLNAQAARGSSSVGVDIFDALYNDNGDPRVELMVRGKRPERFPYKTSDRGWKAV